MSQGYRKKLFPLLGGFLIGVGLCVFLLAGAFFVWGVYRGPEVSSASANQEEAPRTGYIAPEFELENLSGDLIRLSDFRGQPVLVNFWATWCGPCRLEMPDIQLRYETNQSDLVVMAINFDEPEHIVRSFVENLGLSFEVLLDPGGKIQQRYRIQGYPTTFFIDEQGTIRAIHVGMISGNQLDHYLEMVSVGR